jgi:hypothetical protein
MIYVNAANTIICFCAPQNATVNGHAEHADEVTE